MDSPVTKRSWTAPASKVLGVTAVACYLHHTLEGEGYSQNRAIADAILFWTHHPVETSIVADMSIVSSDDELIAWGEAILPLRRFRDEIASTLV